MIVYGFSLQGKSHVEKGTVCQDANKISRLQNGWYVAAAADGVGSAKHSDIGSKMAVEKFVEYCSQHITGKIASANVQEIIEHAYEYAMQSISEYVEKCSGRIEEYDTTLSTVVYDGKTIVYGHAGDGGIIARLADGRIVPLTERQKGVDGTSVRPLRAGANSWEFGTCKVEAVAVLLATDGILDDVLMPYLLNLPESNDITQLMNLKKNHVYVTAAQFLMNPDCVFKNKAISDPEGFMKHFMEGQVVEDDKKAFLLCLQNAYQQMFGKAEAEQLCGRVAKYHYPLWSMQKVMDDKTIVCLMNEKGKCQNQELAYYQDPDWKALQKHYEALAYPGVRQTQESAKTEERPPAEPTKPSVQPKQESKPLVDDMPDLSKKRHATNTKHFYKKAESGSSMPSNRQKVVRRTIDILAAVTIVLLVGAVIWLGVGKTDDKETQVQKPKTSVTEKKKVVSKAKATSTPTPKVETITVEDMTDDELLEEIENRLQEDDASEFFRDVDKLLKKNRPTPTRTPSRTSISVRREG